MRRLISWVAATLLVVTFITAIFGISRYVAFKLYPYTYRELIEQEGERYNIPPLLLAAVIRVESKFNSSTTSRKDARGLMQIVPDTGAWAAEKIGLTPFSPEQLYEPDINIRIGAWYLHHLLDEFEGNLVAALAAYNGGQGNVRTWLRDGWDGSYDRLDLVPFSETRMFVKRVLDDYRVYRWLYDE